eukprot:7139687-Heterocapsa_arctica.AAC.1
MVILRWDLRFPDPHSLLLVVIVFPLRLSAVPFVAASLGRAFLVGKWLADPVLIPLVIGLVLLPHGMGLVGLHFRAV